MTSIKFPNMLSSTAVNTVSGKDATAQNISLLLNSYKNELFGDPYFGSELKRFMYDPSDQVMLDLLKDSIYTSAAEFIPQLKISRDDVYLESDGSCVKVSIRGVDQTSYQTDLYTINLMQ